MDRASSVCVCVCVFSLILVWIIFVVCFVAKFIVCILIRCGTVCVLYIFVAHTMTFDVMREAATAAMAESRSKDIFTHMNALLQYNVDRPKRVLNWMCMCGGARDGYESFAKTTLASMRPTEEWEMEEWNKINMKWFPTSSHVHNVNAECE